MPLKDKRILLIIALGLTLGIFGEYYRQTVQGRRQPASVAGFKANPKSVLAMGKQDRAVFVDLSAPHGTPSENDQELTLRAEITVQQSLPNNELFYSWVLPQGAEIVSGHISDSLPNILPGQKATVEIILTGVSHEQAEKHVIFDAHYLVGENRIGTSAVYSTHRNDENSQLPEPSSVSASSVKSLPGSLKAEGLKPKVHFKQ